MFSKICSTSSEKTKFTVYAKNMAGNGYKSNSHEVILGNVPSQVKFFTIESQTNGVQLRWGSVDSNGFPIRGYEIYRQKENEQSYVIKINSEKREYFDNISEIGNFRYKIRAINILGNGEFTESKNIFLNPPQTKNDDQNIDYLSIGFLIFILLILFLIIKKVYTVRKISNKKFLKSEQKLFVTKNTSVDFKKTTLTVKKNTEYTQSEINLQKVNKTILSNSS